jgi:RimJ/RimL family protein N-acetyltransferase
MTLSVRPFRPDESAVLRDIRLEALVDNPPAFAENAEAARAMGGEDFSRALAAGDVWGAFLDDACVGMAGLTRFVGSNVAHKATIWGVYVSQAGRGAGVAEALFRTMIDHAAQAGVEVFELGVGDFNTRAKRFYARMGFRAYGFEHRAVKLEGRYYDEVLMSLHRV